MALPTEVVKPLRNVTNHEIWHGTVLSHLRGGTSVGLSLDLGRRERFCAWREICPEALKTAEISTGRLTHLHPSGLQLEATRADVTSVCLAMQDGGKRRMRIHRMAVRLTAAQRDELSNCQYLWIDSVIDRRAGRSDRCRIS